LVLRDLLAHWLLQKQNLHIAELLRPIAILGASLQ
jgi:hypothetical protein